MQYIKPISILSVLAFISSVIASYIVLKCYGIYNPYFIFLSSLAVSPIYILLKKNKISEWKNFVILLIYRSILLVVYFDLTPFQFISILILLRIFETIIFVVPIFFMSFMLRMQGYSKQEIIAKIGIIKN